MKFLEKTNQEERFGIMDFHKTMKTNVALRNERN